MYLVWLSKKLVIKQGTSSVQKQGYKLSKQVIHCVTEFYQDDINSRLYPEKKSCVSVEKIYNEYKLKRFVLFSLHEPYILFKQKHPEIHVLFFMA